MTAWMPLLTTKGKESVRLTSTTKIWLNYLLFYLRIKIPKKEVSIYRSKFSKTVEVLTLRVEVNQVARARLTEYIENYFHSTHCLLQTLKFKVLTVDLEI